MLTDTLLLYLQVSLLYKYLIFVQIPYSCAYQYWHYYSCKFWSKSRFSGRAICDTIVNNMNEAFNSIIVDARDKPIITMLETTLITQLYI